MEINIKNLGAVHDATIKIKPLTVFVGPNNTGKTWTAYTIGGILGAFNWGQYVGKYSKPTKSSLFSSLETKTSELIQNGTIEYDLLENFDVNVIDFYKHISDIAPLWISDFLCTKKYNFDDLSVNLKFDRKTIQKLKMNILRTPLDLKTRNKTRIITISLIKKKNQSVIHISIKSNEPLNSEDKEAIKRVIERRIYQIIHQSLYPNVYFFPAERTGLATLLLTPGIMKQLSSKDNDLSKNELNSNTKKEKEKENTVNQSGPIQDFFNTIGKIQFEIGEKKFQKELEKNKEKKNLFELSEILQKKILMGNLDFSTSEPDQSREWLYKYDKIKELPLDMPVVSSTIKDLSVISLYLKYLAKPNELIIIDEPEMNLHPEAQAKFAEFVSMLVNANLNIIITTHSPYIVDHLVNLIKAHECDNPDEIVKEFYLEDKRAFISKDKVAVYLFDGKIVKSIITKNGLIDWETFSKVSENITKIYYSIKG